MSARRNPLFKIRYRAAMNGLFMLLAALTVLFVPISITEASAAVSNHARMMEQMGNCHMASGHPTRHDKMAGRICCVSMSMAVSIARPAAFLVARNKPALSTSLAPTLKLSFLGEIATPPPRHS